MSDIKGRVPSLDMPISRIVDGWSLRDGRLHLHVRCDDGVVRTMTLNTPGSLTPPARTTSPKSS